LAKRQTPHSIDLIDQQNQLFWSGPQSYGIPKQGPFQLDHDTGSSDTILNEGTYNPKASSTAKNTGQNFTISYGDGTTASGPVYTDNFYISDLAVKNQALGVANGASLGLPGAAGISGMAFKSISQFKMDPFFYTLVKQAKIPDVFAYALRRTPGASKLFLGGVDKSSYKGKLTNVPVNSANGFW
ncbi:acid protease, partial [Jaminaea rosea]